MNWKRILLLELYKVITMRESMIEHKEEEQSAEMAKF